MQINCSWFIFRYAIEKSKDGCIEVVRKYESSQSKDDDVQSVISVVRYISDSLDIFS